jgi:tRNA U34 2-thiouridine synthase MnmA/TrmU
VLREQGIDVCWIAFETPFFSAEKARQTSINNKIPIIVKDITERYMPMLKNPACGYGKNMNPCMDCHALMFRIAGEMMEETESDFLFSGEVRGQRPMSQNKNSLRYVEKKSGFDGYILRPLSAMVLPETRMEKEGLVDRERLYGFSGRSRKPQMEMAKRLGVTDYPAPAGGCLLTDEGYSKRLKDLFDHQGIIAPVEMDLLSYGRHLRLDENVKIIVGRNKKDNDSLLLRYRKNYDILLNMKSIPGPVVLIPNGCDSQGVKLAASICAGYSKAPENKPVDVCVIRKDEQDIVTVIPILSKDVQNMLIP